MRHMQRMMKQSEVVPLTQSLKKYMCHNWKEWSAARGRLRQGEYAQSGQGSKHSESHMLL